MPRSTDIRKYGEEWYELSDLVWEAYRIQGTVRFDFPDREEAKRRRLEIYSWVKAMRGEVKRMRRESEREHARIVASCKAHNTTPPDPPWHYLETRINAFQHMVCSQRDNFILIVPTGETEAAKSWRSAIQNASTSGGIDKAALMRQFGIEESNTPQAEPVTYVSHVPESKVCKGDPVPAPDLSAGMYDDIFKDDEK